MTKKFTLDFLTKICNEQNIELLKKYSENDLNSQKIIEFKCVNCKENTSKQFLNIEKYNALCKKCSCYTSKNRIRYDINYLQKICNDFLIILLKDYSNETLNSLTFIEFKCPSCKNNTSKRFQYINLYDAICNNCNNIKKVDKYKSTLLNKFGVENVSQIYNVKIKKKKQVLKIMV